MSVSKDPVTGVLSYSEDRSVLGLVPCPGCGHFAAYKLDGDGAVTYGVAVSYRCALLSCSHGFGGAG